MKQTQIAALVLAAIGTTCAPTVMAQSTAYTVRTAQELLDLGQKTDITSICLKQDLDFSEIPPQANILPTFSGDFDGGGYTISNLTLTGESGANTGLIGELSGTVRNLTLENVSVSAASSSYVGTIAGYTPPGATVSLEHCEVSGTLSSSSTSKNLGGLIGYAAGNVDEVTSLSFENCISNVSVSDSGTGYFGGLLGKANMLGSFSVKNCAILGEYQNAYTAGGLIGYLSLPSSTQITLTDSYLGSKLKGRSKKYVIAYNTSAPSGVTCRNFFYDSEKNPSSYIDSIDYLKYGNYNVTGASGVNTAAILKLAETLDGFEIRKGQFGGYPVPKAKKPAVWSLAQKENQIEIQAAQTQSGTLVFVQYQGKKTELVKTQPLSLTARSTQSVPIPEAFRNSDGAVLLLDSLETLRPLAKTALQSVKE